MMFISAEEGKKRKSKSVSPPVIVLYILSIIKCKYLRRSLFIRGKNMQLLVDVIKKFKSRLKIKKSFIYMSLYIL